RPTKLGRRWLAAWEERQPGRSDEELAVVIARQYEDTYHVSKAKAELAADIAIREEKLIKRLDPDKGFSLYVGVPFCPTRCLYCSFTSNAIGACSRLVEPTLEAMKKEIRDAGSILRHNRPDTVYIGGGTPTSLSAEQLEDLMGAIGESFDLSGTLEYTVEAGRADSITPEKLSVIRKMGAGRISVNPQTMQDETLSLIGRKASSDQVIRAFGMAREEGFDHINMDLILGLPGEDAAKVADTLAKVEALRPDSMTVHTLAVKRGSDLHRIMTEKGYPLNPDTAPAMELAYEAAKRMGLKPYYLYRQKNMSGNQENVGFAKEGKFGIYNILIMEEVQSVYAVGAGTVSKMVYSEGSALKIERCDTHKDVELYIAGIDEMCERKRRLFCGGK
nr:coproporphyrinogen dehydrogenase HemZ [Lachnospiraceae bacterium]